MADAPPVELIATWGLTAAQAIADTPTSRLWQVAYGDNPAVLKVLKPEGADEARGMALMDWYQGRGAARILRQTEGALLMERIPGPPLGDLARRGDDATATAILCDVIGVLQRDRPAPPPGLEPLARRFAPLFDSAPVGDAAKAARLAEALLHSTTDHVALHGDLHHDNILQAERGWLAIDPHGVWGDPAYEPANAFRNPERAEDLVSDPARIVRLADAVVARLGFQLHRVVGWAAAHCALSICWHRETGTSSILDEGLLPRLLAAHGRAG